MHVLIDVHAPFVSLVLVSLGNVCGLAGPGRDVDTKESRPCWLVCRCALKPTRVNGNTEVRYAARGRWLYRGRSPKPGPRCACPSAGQVDLSLDRSNAARRDGAARPNGDAHDITGARQELAYRESQLREGALSRRFYPGVDVFTTETRTVEYDFVLALGPMRAPSACGSAAPSECG